MKQVILAWTLMSCAAMVNARDDLPIFVTPPATHAGALEVEKLVHSAYAVSECRGALRADQPMIPASTLKILTALVALEHWGENHRFETRFYTTTDGTLWVKGFGDPYLVSDEIQHMASLLKPVLGKRIKRIALDTSYFSDDLTIDGRSESNFPYDAPPGALAANFNTVTLEKTFRGTTSAEPQTPLTRVALKVSERIEIAEGPQRINVRNSNDGALHFGQILASKLGKKALHIKVGSLPVDARPVLSYQSRLRLVDLIKPMLQYSNNFIANQLFLALGADIKGGPAGVAKSQAVFNERLAALPGMKDARVIEGSGLSRQNRLSANQLLTLLEHFKPWKALMPQNRGGIPAKTGTLNGTSTLAGYFVDDGEWRPFAVMINQPAARNLRYRTAEKLKRRLTECLPLRSASTDTDGGPES